jgi:hypothetical protein
MPGGRSSSFTPPGPPAELVWASRWRAQRLCVRSIVATPRSGSPERERRECGWQAQRRRGIVTTCRCTRCPSCGSGVPTPPSAGRSLRPTRPPLTACPLRFAILASLAPRARLPGHGHPHPAPPGFDQEARSASDGNASGRLNAAAASSQRAAAHAARRVGRGCPRPVAGRSLRPSGPPLTACPLRFAILASLAPRARLSGHGHPLPAPPGFNQGARSASDGNAGHGPSCIVAT